MGNAAPALLRAADRVLPSNDEDGAALILEELAQKARDA
jgi:hydroxymethylpyrimidine pyrophosphatase-like HAD family hydrolase